MKSKYVLCRHKERIEVTNKDGKQSSYSVLIIACNENGGVTQKPFTEWQIEQVYLSWSGEPGDYDEWIPGKIYKIEVSEVS